MRETLAFHITALYKDFLAYTGDELKKSGLSFGQMPLILYVGKHPLCTQADMTKNLDMDWGYSQRSITKLADSGFLLKEYDKEKSGNLLKLTKKGEDAFEVCHKVFREWDMRKADKLTDKETKTLITLLGKIIPERR